ncbi:MAG: HAD family hydrolase [Bdellovibrionia bacterium]
MSSEFLRQFFVKMKELENQGQGVHLVFDLDSTLFDVSPRTERILREFIADPTHRRLFPDECEKIEKIQVTTQDWGFAAALKRVGFVDLKTEFYQQLLHYWAARFFSDSYLHYDQPYPGSVEFLQRLVSFTNVNVAYLTGRDQHRMGLGSPEVLKKWDFPLMPQKAELILKPHRSLIDADFKAEWFKNHPLVEAHEFYFFENEPVNLNRVSEITPQVKLIYFDSTHSGKEEPPSHATVISHYKIDEES